MTDNVARTPEWREEMGNAIPNRASDFDPDIEHPVHLGKATPEETIRVNTGKANVRDATPNSVAEIRADERRRIAAEIEQLEPRYPNLVSRAAIRGLLRG